MSPSGDFVSLCRGLCSSVRTITQQNARNAAENHVPLSVVTDKSSAQTLRELPSQMALDKNMRKQLFVGAVSVALVGVALAQVEASSSVYFLDVDPARYAGPAGQRLAVRVDDAPRHITISDQDEICVQLQRSSANGDVISAKVRALRPEPHDAVVVKVAGPGISPGTFRSTPWGMLLRVVPNSNASAAATLVKPVGTNDAPVCSL